VFALGAFLAKFGVVLLKLKALIVLGSMLVSVAAYALFYGWSFAIGLVLLIFVHEMGHVVVLRRQGIPASAPVFLPFLGAFVKMRGTPRDAWQEAVSGLAGPVAGSIGAAGVWWYADATGSQFLRALAFVGFLINLFNLLPVLPLDGGRAAAALHPAIWAVGLAGLIVLEVYHPSPVIPLILVLGGLELWRRWKSRGTEASRRYYQITRAQRWAIGSGYIALAGALVLGMHATYLARPLH